MGYSFKWILEHLSQSLQSVSSSYAATASVAGTASFITASNVWGPFGSNSIISSSYALTASYALNAGAGGGGTPGGANTTIQFNDSSTFSGSNNFTFDKTTNIVQLTGSLNVSSGITGSLLGTASFALSSSKLISNGSSQAANLNFPILSYANATIPSNGEAFAPIALSNVTINPVARTIQATASFAGTASFITGSNVYGPFGSNSIVSASYAVSSSVSLSSVSSSFSISSSQAVSSSYTLTASFALSTINGAIPISFYNGNSNTLLTSNLSTLYVSGSGVSISSPSSGIVSMSVAGLVSNISGSDQYLARFSGSNAVETGSIINYRAMKSIIAGNDLNSFAIEVSGSAMFGSGSRMLNNFYNLDKVSNAHSFGRFNVNVGSDVGVNLNYATSVVGSYDLVQNLLASTAPRVHFSCYEPSKAALFAPFAGDINLLSANGKLDNLLVVDLISGSISYFNGAYYPIDNSTLINAPSQDFVDYTGAGNYNGIGISVTQEYPISGSGILSTRRGNLVCFVLAGGEDGYYDVNANHAENIGTSAHGYGTHAEGYYSQTRGQYTHAQNDSTIAAGSGSTASGLKTAASGEYNSSNGVFSSAGPTFIIRGVDIIRSNNLIGANDYYYDYNNNTVDNSATAGHEATINWIASNDLGNLFNNNLINNRDKAISCIIQIPSINFIGLVELFAIDFTVSSVSFGNINVITLLDIVPDNVDSITTDLYITPIKPKTFFEDGHGEFGGGPAHGAFTIGIQNTATNSGSFAGGLRTNTFGSHSFSFGTGLDNFGNQSILFGSGSTNNFSSSFIVSYANHNELFVNNFFVGVNSTDRPYSSFKGLRVSDDLWVLNNIHSNNSLSISGSTRLGDDLLDTTTISGSLLVHNFARVEGTSHVTGSLIVSNSFTSIGTNILSGSNLITGSWNLVGSGIVTGSLTVSSSLNVIGKLTVTGSFTNSGSYQLLGNSSITGSLIVSSSLTTIGTNTTTGSVFITGSSTLIGNQTITGSILMTGSAAISYVNHIDFFTSSAHSHLVGRIHWDNDYGTLNIDLNSTTGNEIMSKVGQDQFYYIKNQTGVTLTKGKVIRAAGTLGASGRILGDYMIADGTIPYFYTIGIAAESIGNGQDGYVYEFGLLRGIQTDGANYGETWTDGTILYVSPTNSGGLTSVEPTAPNLKIQIAIVIKADASNGSIFIRPDLRSNINDLHNVKITAPSSSGDLLVYSSSVWINSKQLTGSYGLTGSLTFLNGGITGSLFGTASWAHSASYAFTASFVTGSIFTNLNPALSASYALTSSYALFASTASSTLFALTEGAGISDFSFDGSSATTIAVSGAASLTTNYLTLWTGNAFASSNLEDMGNYTLSRESFYISASFRVLGDGVTITDPAFQVDPVSGVTSIGTYQGTPVAQPGGMYFDGTDWYLGV